MAGPLLVASPGGHLDELLLMVDQLGVPQDDAVWVSAETTQTRSVLGGRCVVWLPRIGSGERHKAMQAFPAAARLHRRLRPSLVVSTGALFAVPHLMAASGHRCPTWFIDSATRVNGPSQTGRFAQRLPRVRLMAQGEGWGDPRWESVPNVLDAFVAEPRAAAGPVVPAAVPVVPAVPSPQRVVVTVGTELWPFPRAVEAVLRLGPVAEVVWQTGSTVVRHAGRLLPQWLPAEELHGAIAAADVVVTHAGVGSVLACLHQGTVPVVLPRRARHGEHIDDHQLQFARLLEQRGLAVVADPDDLTGEHLVRAASLRARRQEPSEPSDPLAHPLHGPHDAGR